MISVKERNQLFTSGLLAGAATPYILRMVMVVLNWLGAFVPAVQLKLAGPEAITVNIRESLTGLPATLANYLTDLLGVTVPDNILMTTAIAALGGGLLFLAGGYLADAVKMLEGNARQKTMTVIFIGSAAVAFALGQTAVTIGIPLVNTLIAFGINAAILSAVYVWLDKQTQLKWKLTPF